jgi:hypothetical protein
MKILIISFAFLLVMFQLAVGQIPQTLSYQGVLTDAGGNPVVDGDYNLTFRLYETESGGTAIWTEEQTTSVVNGLFNVILGKSTSYPIAFDKPYWLGITIDSGTELLPRIELTSSAYSLNSRSVYGSSNVFPSDGYVGIGTTSPGSELDIRGSNPDDAGGMNIANSDASHWLFFRSGRLNSSDPLIAWSEGDELLLGSFSTVFNESMRFTSNGNVGIGITSPNEQLEVAGTISSTTGGFKFPDGSVQITAASGDGTGTADNLGNHTATQNLILNGNWISHDGENEGIFVSETGYVGIGTTLPDMDLEVNCKNGIIFSGSYEGGIVPDRADLIPIKSNISSTGPSTLLFWYPSKSAFGVGQVSGDQWNIDSLGYHSISFGYNTKANGWHSTAMGYGSVSSGIYSTAMGFESSASDFFSVAMGNSRASAQGSTAIGQSNASGRNSVAMGMSTSSGAYSYSMGYNCRARDIFGWAIGNNAKSNHPGAFVWSGANNTPGADSVSSTASNQFIIYATGGVGIGANTPKGQLDVNGSIYQRGSQLHADYVFHPDYKLESIEEHTEFMWTNKHLKAIPKMQLDESGDEIVEVGSHRRGIVEELEKAHIYIDELLIRIKNLETRLTKLEKTQH